MGDTPSSSFHTQTLTQLLSGKGEEDDDGLGLIKDSDDDEEDEMELPEIRQGNTSKNSRERGTVSRSASIIPQTPSHRKITVDLTEIPSTQSSPFSPGPRNSFLSPIRSPLKDKSANINAPPPTVKSIMKRPRHLVVQNSYSSVNSSPLSGRTQSPAKVSSARARQCPDLPPASVELGESMAKNSPAIDDTPAQTPRRNPRRIWVEVPDSDAELESVGPSPEKVDTTPGTPRFCSNTNEVTPVTHNPLREQSKGEGDSEEPCHEDEFTAGPETPTPLVRKDHLRFSSQEPEEMYEAIPVTPSHMSSAVPRAGRTETQARSQFTQAMESQRIPMEVIRAMGPQTDRSDIIISIHPGPAEDIVNGTKNHEFRNYKIPTQVSRIWIYVTHPICELRYMAVIGPAKQPGEVDDENGLGNAEFDSGASGYKFAHELLQVYQLNNAVPLATMKENGWVGSPPQKYVYTPPAVVGQLLANLRCALFDENVAGNDHGLSISQEVEEQLRSDIFHSTQIAADGRGVTIPSSRGPSPEADRPSTATQVDDVFAKPSLPARIQSEVIQRTPTKPGAAPFIVPPSQATTASEPSSPVQSPEKSPIRPEPFSQLSGLSFPEYADERSFLKQLPAGLPFSLSSSQPMLPESLFVDDVRQPPIILDSDDEGSDS